MADAEEARDNNEVLTVPSVINVDDEEGEFSDNSTKYSKEFGEDFKIIAMETGQLINKDDDCVIIGDRCVKRKRKNRNTECFITGVSCDGSHDLDYLLALELEKNINDVVIVSAKDAPVVRKRNKHSKDGDDIVLLEEQSMSSSLTTSLKSPSVKSPAVAIVKPFTSSLDTSTCTSPSSSNTLSNNKCITPTSYSSSGPLSLGECEDFSSLTNPLSTSSNHLNSISHLLVDHKNKIRKKREKKSKRPHKFCIKLPLQNITIPKSSSTTSSFGTNIHESSDCLATKFITSSSVFLSNSSDPPSWWSECDSSKPYTLIDLNFETSEARIVYSPVAACGFNVTKIQRIQSHNLWRRYMGEVRLLIEERGEGYQLDERLLYHCSQADKSVICSEGLDVRLSRNGNFGRGIYFSDKPQKCDGYSTRRPICSMFACKVILGDMKVYPVGKGDHSLIREPKKSTCCSYRNNYYDSVLGFISVGEEFVIYNNYRAVPLYYMEYTH